MVKSNTRTKGPASTRTKEPVHGQKGQYTDKSARTRTKGPKVQDPNPNPTTIAEKLRAIRQAIEYVSYLNEHDQEVISRGQTVKDRLKIWGKALTKDIRRQRNENLIKASYEVSVISHFIKFHTLV